MIDRELRKLRRFDLLEMMIELESRNEELAQENEMLRARAAEREIRLSQAGSIAEAALQLNSVFEAAQEAADQYLENIRLLERELEARSARIQEEAQLKAEKIVAQAHESARQIESGTEKRCREMTQQAQQQIERHWKQIVLRVEHYFADHPGLKEVLGIDEIDVAQELCRVRNMLQEPFQAAAPPE